MKNLTTLISIFLITSFAFAQAPSVDVKDSDGHTMIQISDEGDNGGSIILPDAVTVSPTSEKLYNKGGKLYWENTELGAAAIVTPSGWTDDGTEVYLTTGTDQVGIGTETPDGALDIVSSLGALIVPRMTSTERDGIPEINGSIIYNTSDEEFNFRENDIWITK